MAPITAAGGQIGASSTGGGRGRGGEGREPGTPSGRRPPVRCAARGSPATQLRKQEGRRCRAARNPRASAHPHPRTPLPDAKPAPSHPSPVATWAREVTARLGLPALSAPPPPRFPGRRKSSSPPRPHSQEVHRAAGQLGAAGRASPPPPTPSPPQAAYPQGWPRRSSAPGPRTQAAAAVPPSRAPRERKSGEEAGPWRGRKVTAAGRSRAPRRGPAGAHLAGRFAAGAPQPRVPGARLRRTPRPEGSSRRRPRSWPPAWASGGTARGTPRGSDLIISLFFFFPQVSDSGMGSFSWVVVSLFLPTGLPLQRKALAVNMYYLFIRGDPKESRSARKLARAGSKETWVWPPERACGVAESVTVSFGRGGAGRCASRHKCLRATFASVPCLASSGFPLTCGRARGVRWGLAALPTPAGSSPSSAFPQNLAWNKTAHTVIQP